MGLDLKPETERLVTSLGEVVEPGIPSQSLPGNADKTRAEAVAHIRAIRSRTCLPPGVTIRDLIDEGRD